MHADNDETYLRQVLEQARAGIHEGHGPFAAMIVLNGRELARANNSVTLNNDPTAHAEVLAIRQACESLADHQLGDAVLYSSCEPCPMCLAAAHWAHIGRIVYAGSADDAATGGFDDRYISEQLCLHREGRSLISQRLLAEEGAEVFSEWLAFPDKQPY